MSENLLVTKRYIPSPAPNHTPRPRLYQILAEGPRLGRRLTLVCAPAGYGKTTLIAEWIHHHRLSAAWLSIDEGDNDPVRFLTYLVASIQTVRPEIGDLSPFQTTPGKPFEPDLVSLVNGLADLPVPLLLVLDDYHGIHIQSVHDSLAFIIENLPPQVQVIIATRADPPLPIARWRARGYLQELRMSDLRFTADEASHLLNQALSLSLSPEDTARLFARTEGWAAGLQMAALALQAQASAQGEHILAEFIRTFTGSNRYILDYFIEEVLQRQPRVVLAFLQQTSILERMCASLCDAVTGIGDWCIEDDERASTLQAPISARKILEHLENANLFIVSLDDRREWYRYHRLFGDLLQQRLSRAQPESVALLHQRASAWYEQHDWMEEAIRHAFAAGDSQRAAQLIEAAAESTLMRSEIVTFMRWIEQLPEAALFERPDLVVYHAMTLLWSGAPLEMIESKLAMIERVEQPSGKEAPLRAFIALNQGQLSLAKEYCRQALALIPESNLFLRGLADLMQALCFLVEGELQTGVQLLEKAAVVNQKMGNLMVAVMVLYQLAELRQKEGQLHQAQELYQQVLELAGDPQGRYLPISGRALVGLGEIAWARNDLEAAQQSVLEGIKLCEEWSQVSAFDGYMALVAIRQSQRDMQGAEQALNTLRQLARQFDVTEIDDQVVDLIEVRLRLAQGDLAAAQRWAKQYGLERFTSVRGEELGENIVRQRLHKYEILPAARLWLAEGRPDEVLEVLEGQLTRLEKAKRPVLLIETELLRALAFLEKNETTLSMQALEHALCLAEPEGYVRIFIDEGEKVQALLLSARSVAKIKPWLAFVDTILSAFSPAGAHGKSIRPPRPEALLEPLSERELEVLRLLPSSLSSREMAGELYISVHTLRSHLKSIYAKLGVHSRYEAIARVRELSLL